MVFTIFGCSFWRKSKIKFLHTSMKSLTNCVRRIPSSGSLFLVTLTVVLKAACNPENCNCTLEKIKHLKRGKAGTEPWCGADILELENFFKEASRNFIFVYLLAEASKKNKINHLRMRKYWFNFIWLQKIFIWRPNSLQGVSPAVQ